MSTQFGRYLIEEEERDRGRFGRVYRACDPNFDHHVAIKMLSAKASPDLFQRLETDGPAVVGLKHENIVQVYSFGQRDGVPYLVMEPLLGQTLESIIQSGASGAEALRLIDQVQILVQVAKGLQYAHSAGAIHGDIQPANILVLPNQAVKILDFGIARIVDKGAVTSREADIVAYGRLCYRLIAGTHPPGGGDLEAAIENLTRSDPPSIRSIVPECPEALDSLILGLLATNREPRPDCLQETIRELEAIAGNLPTEPVASTPESVPALVEPQPAKSPPDTVEVVVPPAAETIEVAIPPELANAIGSGRFGEPNAGNRGVAGLSLPNHEGSAGPGPIVAPDFVQELAALRASTPRPAAPVRPGQLSREQTMLLLGIAAIFCSAVVYMSWSLRPILLRPVPQGIEFHQECGRLTEAAQVEWSVPGLPAEVRATPSWLRASLTSSGVRISVSDATLSPGVHTGTVRVDFRSIRVLTSTISIPVKLIVTIGADPQHLIFQYQRGAEPPVPQSVIVVGARNVTASTDAQWLKVDAGPPAENPIIRVSVDPAALATGDYHGEVRLKDQAGYECRATVALTVTEASPAAVK
jgi:hypothetical protein